MNVNTKPSSTFKLEAVIPIRRKRTRCPTRRQSRSSAAAT